MIAYNPHYSPQNPIFRVYGLRDGSTKAIRLDAIESVAEGRGCCGILTMGSGAVIETDRHVAEIMSDLVQAGLLPASNVPATLLECMEL